MLTGLGLFCFVAGAAAGALLVASRYMKEPGKTRQTIDDEGFLHSGDVGTMRNGMLYITGRIKELIITAGGTHACVSESSACMRMHAYVHADARVCGGSCVA